MFLGANTLQCESSRERKFPGQLAPGNKSSRKRKGQGAKVPGCKLARVPLADLLQRANCRESEKAVNPEKDLGVWISADMKCYR